ncbi:hypothetical protein Ahy_A02g009923 [Arachis hypogaea]|uniref:NB-ARC domain-containing protein n=1 Tax=Arachis hypogaea TaxID=3818 RepID=A0A445EII0_ARAHY|nr:hypothetical protein Ahy_A02g009923 [Arachis hypogaea]
MFFFKPEYPADTYVMHDLLHDLAIFLAGDFYCRIQELREQEEKKVLTRHFSYFPPGRLDHPISKVFKSIVKPESLRTSLYIDDLLSMESRASKLKYLRVLSFRRLDVLPDSIGKSIHLRYLNLSGTDVKTLPESLCNLYNLQTLILYFCSKLTMLPDGMLKLMKLRHLVLRGTCLKEMPRGISKLKHMHILDYFVVGKHKDNGIQELGGLSNLQGSFEIKKLENVVDVRQARSARMLEKNHIDKLWLEWSSDDEMVSNTETGRDILDGLQPHNGLKELRMKGYKGETFPDWVGRCSYNNMTTVWLESCKNCCMLPSLGQLPSLKSLYMEGFLELKCIGDEFYKSDNDHHSSPIAPFPTLEELVFDNMRCWEEWHVPDPEAFPRLRRLEIRDCEMLKGDMVNGIFGRRDCFLREDEEGRCDEMVGGGDALSIRPSQSFNATTINHLCCLQELLISGCPSIVSFPDNCLPKSLQKLKIWRCPKFEFPEQQQRNYDLVQLQIQDSCDPLSSLSLDVFPNLKNLEIEGCRNLESVSMSEAPHAALQRLSISWCFKLVSFAGEGLAARNLTHLQVSFCSKLEALPRDMKSLLPSLHSLKISGCKNICRLPEGGLPPNLKELYVGGCEEQLWDLSWIANFHALTHLRIEGYYDCDNIKSYLGSLPHLPSLTTLEIWGFDNLETLECNELLRLTSLQQLHIHWCPKLENMEGEKLPPSLLLLQLTMCGLLGEHCKNKHQLIWPKISHIPTIQIGTIDVVGGALLSGFINIVINKSLREDVVNRVLGKKLGPGLVERLKISLHAAEAVLDDAEYKELGHKGVRDWLNCLRDAVYDADDFLDAVLTKAATKKEVRSVLPSFFLNRHRKMVDNMEGVVARIEFLVSQKDNLGLQKTTKDNNLSSSSWRETTCKMEGSIYGREDDQQALIKIIHDNSESQLYVIPIVGMGGVGKTTLAKWAYSVAEGFDLKAWVCISETFDVAENTRKTIEELTENSYRPNSKVFKFDMKLESLRTSFKKSRASKLKYLRVLSFRELDALPGSIGELIHLRYLNLSWTEVKTLPESICNLYNLQTLILYRCSYLTMLPKGMHKLVNLRHLDLRGTCLKEMPRGISKLKHLHTLSSFVVGKHKDNGIQELGGLSNLEGSFEIKKLENVADAAQARSAKMEDKNHIDKLWLEWSSDDEMVSNTETERDILVGLQPHNGLKELTIKGYMGERFPDLVGHYSYNNMTRVSLESCKNCYMLPSLGQLPSLKSLLIEGFDQLKRIGDEFYSNHHSSPTPFPSLENLVFNIMPCWEEWHVPDPKSFPQLKKL